ncbi:MAG: hypothetical protein QN229_01885 [Desulfurococcaceae archaeon TW002]
MPVSFLLLSLLALVYSSIEIVRLVNNRMLGFVPDCVLTTNYPRRQELELNPLGKKISTTLREVLIVVCAYLMLIILIQL